MIILCTDYGSSIYTGQVVARILDIAPQTSIVSLVDDLPAYNPKASAYLLSALVSFLPSECIVVAVVDPEVGSERAPICFKYRSRWFVGPDNGLFSRVLSKDAAEVDIYRISIDLSFEVSTTFHGRDIFAPAAAKLALGENHLPKSSYSQSETKVMAEKWPEDLAELIYFDQFGNGYTGILASSLHSSSRVMVNGQEFSSAIKFSDVEVDEGFWYRNSIGLVEISVNQGSARSKFQLEMGMPVSIH